MICCAVCREPIVFEGGKWVRLARGEHIDDPAGDQHGGLAAPVNTWLTMPVWTAETLTEDDWENDGHALSFTVTDPGDGGPDRDIRTTREAP